MEFEFVNRMYLCTTIILLIINIFIPSKSLSLFIIGYVMLYIFKLGKYLYIMYKIRKDN